MDKSTKGQLQYAITSVSGGAAICLNGLGQSRCSSKHKETMRDRRARDMLKQTQGACRTSERSC